MGGRVLTQDVKILLNSELRDAVALLGAHMTTAFAGISFSAPLVPKRIRSAGDGSSGQAQHQLPPLPRPDGRGSASPPPLPSPTPGANPGTPDGRAVSGKLFIWNFRRLAAQHRAAQALHGSMSLPLDCACLPRPEWPPCRHAAARGFCAVPLQHQCAPAAAGRRCAAGGTPSADEGGVCMQLMGEGTGVQGSDAWGQPSTWHAPREAPLPSSCWIAKGKMDRHHLATMTGLHGSGPMFLANSWQGHEGALRGTCAHSLASALAPSVAGLRGRMPGGRIRAGPAGTADRRGRPRLRSHRCGSRWGRRRRLGRRPVHGGRQHGWRLRGAARRAPAAAPCAALHRACPPGLRD